MTNWLSRMSVTAKLATIVALALGALAAVTFNGLRALSSAGAATLGVMDNELVVVRDLGQARLSVSKLLREEKDLLLNLGDEKAFASHFVEWGNEEGIAEAGVRSIIGRLDVGERPRIDPVLAHLARYRKGVEAIVQRVRTGEINDPWSATRAVEPLKSEVAAIDQGLDELVRLVGLHVQSRRISLLSAARTQRVLSLVTVAAAAALLAALAWAVSRSITRPLASAIAALDRVAAGDLTQTIGARGSDELARMTLQLARMQDALRALAAGIRDSADGVARASAEIAQSNLDLSNRTEQQASSLQQTAASMTQMSSTVRAGADAARDAARLAVGATAAATRGRQLVDQAVATMVEIETSNRRVADIVGVIDAIAFQTNVLALNAAVEAARAGEQGRGFAVVAAEVRALAGRSAAAAREVKALIAASVERVTGGAAVVTEAGGAMEEIVQRVVQMNQLIGRLSKAAAEQSQGIGDIGRTLSQLDSATQQNAALVEQSAAATDSLKGQSARLAESATVFRLT